MVTTIPRLFFICLNALVFLLAEFLALMFAEYLVHYACGILWS